MFSLLTISKFFSNLKAVGLGATFVTALFYLYLLFNNSIISCNKGYHSFILPFNKKLLIIIINAIYSVDLLSRTKYWTRSWFTEERPSAPQTCNSVWFYLGLLVTICVWMARIALESDLSQATWGTKSSFLRY